MEPGRPKSEIDWTEVEKLLIEGCSGAEIAGNLGIYKGTLYDRCLTDKGLTFAQYSQLRRAKGKSLIRSKQFEIAMQGNVSMLIWLGKVRCKQQETTVHNHGFIFQEIDPTSREPQNIEQDSGSIQVPMPSLPGCSMECIPGGD